MILTWIGRHHHRVLPDGQRPRAAPLKLIERDGAEKHEVAIDATRLYIHDAMARIESGREERAGGDGRRRRAAHAARGAAPLHEVHADQHLGDSHAAGGQGRGCGRLYLLIDEDRIVRRDLVNQPPCFLSRNNGRNKNAAGTSASPQYEGGVRRSGWRRSVRVREPRSRQPRSRCARGWINGSRGG